MIFNWKLSFIVCGIMLVAMGILSYTSFLIFERKGFIKYDTLKEVASVEGQGVKVLFKNEIVKYTLVSALTGVIRTAVMLWIPTYLTQYVGFSETTSVGLFSVITLVISLTPYLMILVVYEKIFKSNRNTSLTFSFVLSALSFFMMFFFKQQVLNVIFLILALMSNAGASNILWSVYCPSLSKTGMVSTATGFLDFVSYIAAAISNIIFANSVETIGWGWLIVVWAVLMLIGFVISISHIFKKKNKIAI
jgi:sugar phosphate permease